MDMEGLDTMRQYVDSSAAAMVDARSMGGEVVKIPILNVMQTDQAIEAVASNLAYFMEKLTGRGYRRTDVVSDRGFTVREPGHEAYGLRVSVEENCVIVSRVALLEDETLLGRYVRYVQTGVLI